MSSMDEVILAINFIEANLTKKMDLDMISGAVHYSKYHLHRVFSDTVGLTIHDYIQRRQLTEAAKLLVFSGKPIVQIAFLSGYQSQQAFTNAFTAMYKMPPNMYRENERFYPLQIKFNFEGRYEMLFSYENGSIDFMGSHPLYRKKGVPKAMLDKVMKELLKGKEISITTYREGDKADTGYRKEIKGLGFAEAELLVEYGYPTQRFILQQEEREHE